MLRRWRWCRDRGRLGSSRVDDKGRGMKTTQASRQAGPRQTGPRQTLTAPIRKSRFAAVALMFCFWTVVIALRLTWLQVFQHGEWVTRAAKQQTGAFEVAPRRGVLYDRNLKELAMTVLVDSVYAVPSEVGENNKAATAQMLARIVHTDPTDNFTTEHQMLARFNASHGFAWVARRVDKATADRIKEMNLKGVYIQKEFKRFYPNNELARMCWGMWGRTIRGWAGWSCSSTTTCMACRGTC